jgi:hypothetical protein
MFCTDCGKPVAESAKFCAHCARPLDEAQSHSVMWETCEIGYAEASSGFFSGTVIFHATVTGPKGTYVTVKSAPFKGEWNQFHKCWFPGLAGSPESHQALEYVMLQLSMDGWEMVDRGIPRYQYRYRRLVGR